VAARDPTLIPSVDRMYARRSGAGGAWERRCGARGTQHKSTGWAWCWL